MKTTSELLVSHTFFCDESGHSGANLLKIDDPILVEAVVAISNEQLPGILSKIAELSIETQAPELKFSKLHRTPKGRLLIGKLAGLMDSERIVVFLAVIEKRFKVATMIVETFLDPTYNSWAPAESATGLRIDAANIILGNTSIAELESFVISLRDSNRAGARGFGEILASRLKLNPDSTISSLGRIIEHGLPDFFWFSDQVDGAPPRHDKPNPIIYSFGPMLARIHAFLEEEDWVADLIADEDAHFGSVLDHQWSLIKSEASSPFLAEFNFPTNGLPRWKSYRRKNYNEEPALQLADVSAGLFRMVAVLRLKGSNIDRSDELHPAWESLHHCIERSRGNLHVLVSNENKSGRLLHR